MKIKGGRFDTKGRIIKYFDDKGYGFINDDNGNDIFFHISQVKSMKVVERGQIVDFVLAENDKGYIATNTLALHKT